MSESDTQVLTDQLKDLRAESSSPAPAQPPAKDAVARAKLKAPNLPFQLNASAAVWVGLVVTALGFGTIFYSWIRVAGLLDVGRQMPYVVSGAMTGLGLIVVGVAVVDMAVRRQDRIERRHQMALMRNLLEELREVMGPSEAPDRGERK
jgi:uncharacterized membrane protein